MTINDICERLDVTVQRVYNAIYSGEIPRPNGDNEWDNDYIELYLTNWQARIERRKKG